MLAIQGFSNLLNLLLGVKIGFHSVNRTEFQGWNDFEGIRGIGMLVIDARELYTVISLLIPERASFSPDLSREAETRYS